MHRIATRWLVTVSLAAPLPALAQAPAALPPAASAPINVMLPNYNSMAVGELGGLEANAYLARVADASAGWYNPAGLALATQTSLSGSAGTYQTVAVKPEHLETAGSSFQQIPSMTSLVLKNLFGSPRWSGGFSLTRVNAWSQFTDVERESTTATGSERVVYSSQAAMSGWAGNLGAGYSGGGKWRVGATLDGHFTSFDRGESFGDQYLAASGLHAVLTRSHSYSWVTHLRMSVGAQYDLLPGVRLGAVVRTPGLPVLDSGSYTHEGMATVGATTVTASFFDEDASVEYRLPAEFKVGAAWSGKRARVEVDLLAHLGGGTYQAAESAQSWTIITDTDTGTGAPPAVLERPFVSPVVESRPVVNVAVGGQVDLTASGSWKLHAGYATDRSPVGPADTYFTKIDMQAFTAGVSGRTKHFLGSLGVRYEGGTSDEVLLGRLEGGQALTARLKMSNLGLVYSLAVLF